MKRTLLLFLLVANCLPLPAQESETQEQRLNTIKVDLTSYWLYRRSYVFSYERVVKPHQTFAITLGYQEFPKLVSFGGGIHGEKEDKRVGYKVGGEYRFYLKRENKYLAPRGVYLGPYISYLFFNNERGMTIDNDDGTVDQAYLKTKLSVLNVGFQLGYQFVFKDRWTIDLVFIGPSVSRYTLDMKLDGNFTPDEGNDHANAIVDRLLDAFPLLDELVDEKEIDAHGKTSSMSYGYRYQTSIGYRFGKKKQR
jgi:hypothetical protein